MSTPVFPETPVAPPEDDATGGVGMAGAVPKTGAYTVEAEDAD